ncbi:MAG TPA: histidine kinase dimerization/phosphoacceptor domain -containing protein [Caulobacteraceae bacterium]|jgi:two-component sensor histidine kinase|nr:histidine kinase dimerization/phosphoacceptor domain -containing protein [Caulobacteraceae bacterium]
MTGDAEDKVADLLDTPQLADALESERFKDFLDHIPIAVAVAELQPRERIVYVNLEFERLTGRGAGQVEGQPWTFLPGEGAGPDDHRRLGDAIGAEQDYLGVFAIDLDARQVQVDVWSNIIRDDAGEPVFRLLALADSSHHEGGPDLKKLAVDQDVRLRELQHRVRNNLQMITALIRLEARNVSGQLEGERFERLAGRIEALNLLYERLDGAGDAQTVDLGAYLGQIATSVMAAHAVEGVHLDLALDSWPVKVDVAMPTGLVLNEVVTNALKHAFPGAAGRIRIEGVTDDEGCTVTVRDDGVGLPAGQTWPQPGKLGMMIVHALRENAGARVDVRSAPGEGVEVTLRFDKARARA